MALYTDKYTLSTDGTFKNRVEQAMIDYAAKVAIEADTILHHYKRGALATKVLNAPSAWSPIFVTLVTTDASVAASAPIQATVTDAQIDVAIAAVWNPVAGARDRG
ncbi:MAG: hypothetical protein ACRDGM_04630 [bacterium]